MRIHRKVLIAGSCTLALALMAQHPAPKAGLYEVNSRMTWQQSPFPDDMQKPPGAGDPHTGQTCYTREQIDKYNGPKPEAHGGNCQITNILKRRSGMTADMSCGPPMSGKGTIETIWTDSGHNKSKVHFTGSMHVGKDLKTVEWTIETESTYKAANCGSIKPSSAD